MKKIYEVTPSIDLVIDRIDISNALSPINDFSTYKYYTLEVKLLVRNDLFYGTIEIGINKKNIVSQYSYYLHKQLAPFEMRCVLRKTERELLEKLFQKIVLESEVKND